MKNIHLKVNFHEGGFFSNFNKVTTFLKNTKDKVVSIEWNLIGQPYGAFAYSCGEVFSKLFTHYKTGDNIEEEFILNTYGDTSFTGKEVHTKYNQAEWRGDFNTVLKYFIPQPKLSSAQERIKSTFPFNNNKIKIIGILKRNNLLQCEQIDNKMPSLSDYYEQIDKFYDTDTYLYLAVDNIHDLNSFIDRYKRCIYNPKMRRTNYCTDREPHFTPGTEEDAMYTYLEVYSLSLCNKFIHPLSNMSTAVLYFNPNIESIYI